MAFGKSIQEIENEIKEQFAFALKNDPIKAKDFLKVAKMNLERALRLTDFMKYNLDYTSFDGRINESLLKTIRHGEYRGIGPTIFCNNNIIGYYCAIMDRGFKKEEMKPTENIYHVDKHTMKILLEDMIKNDKYDVDIILIAQKVLDKDKVNALVMESILKTLKPENAYILNNIDIDPKQKDELYPKLIKKYKLLNKDLPINYQYNSHILLALLEDGRDVRKIGGTFQDDFSEVSKDYLTRLSKSLNGNLDLIRILNDDRLSMELNPNILLALKDSYMLKETDTCANLARGELLYESRYKNLTVNKLALVTNQFGIESNSFKMKCLTIMSKGKDISDDKKIELIEKLNFPLNFFDISFVINNQEKLNEKKLISSDDKEVLRIYNQGYSLENEKALLKVIGNYKSVEEYVDSLIEKQGANLDIKGMCAIAMYSKKRLNALGLNNVKVAFEYIDRDQVGGQYNEYDKTLKLSTNALQKLQVADIVKVIHHEIYHAKQHKNVKEMNTEEEDLLEHSIDILLTGLYPNYYAMNYANLSFEHDADHKAFLDISLKAIKDKDKFVYEGEHIYNRMNEYYTETNLYKRDFTRKLSNDGESVDMYTLMDEIIKNLYEHSPTKYKEIVGDIQKNAPILGYLYDFSTGKRKSMSELFNSYKDCKDEKEKKIYSYLINNLCDKRKHDDATKNSNIIDSLCGYTSIFNGVDLSTIYPELKNIKETKGKYQKYSKYYEKQIEELGMKIRRFDPNSYLNNIFKNR